MSARGRPSLAERVNARWPDFRGDRPLVAVFIVALAMTACFERAEADTFWQLRAGQDIVRSGHVALVDRFSHTAAGRVWPDHEWLWQAATYVVHAIGGMPLLAASMAALVLATFALVSRLTVGPAKEQMALIAVAVFVSGAPWSVRPHTFTHLALLATLMAVVRGRLWPLPLLFVLWTNVHGAVVLGFVVLGAALVVAALARDGAAVARLALVTALCAAATLAGPLGTRLYTFIPESMERSREIGVSEWRPATSFSFRDVGFWASSAALVALAARYGRRLAGREDRLVVLVALLFVPLAFRATRNVAPFGLLFAPAASRLLATRVRSDEPESPPAPHDTPARNVRDLAVAGAVAATAVVVAWAWPLPLLNWTPVSAEAAAAIRACPPNLYNDYNQGGSLIWFVPEVPVFVDGREDPYPLEFLRRAAMLERDVVARRAAFAEFGVHCAAVPPASSLWSALRLEGWRETFRDGQWVVLADR
jgi:hypothetical protein